MKSFLLALTCMAALSGYGQQRGGTNGNAPQEVPVVPAIKEGSGIADSKTHPGALWVIEDSGNPAAVILLGHNGKVRGRLPVRGASNRDWEDIVLSAGFLYIGDIGDNGQKREVYQLYKFPEPPQGAKVVARVEVISFRYEDGPHDAEAFLVSPISGDIFLITKRDKQSGVYKIARPGDFSQVSLAKKVATLPFTGVVSAALEPGGGAVLVETYGAIYRFAPVQGQPLEAAFSNAPAKMPYKGEPQGEAVCFRLDGRGYFTLSEQLLKARVNLAFYPLP